MTLGQLWILLLFVAIIANGGLLLSCIADYRQRFHSDDQTKG